MNLRSQKILQGPEFANVRALYKSGGSSDIELTRPMIGVVDAYSSVCPGHANLKLLSTRVREGIYAAGGTPVTLQTIGACDGVTMGHEGMKYVLPTREMIANDIEAMTQGHQLDGLVLLGSCDKIVPGMLIGALRVNVPAILLCGGPTLPGRMPHDNPYGGVYIDHSVIQQSEGALRAGRISPERFAFIENNAVPTIGSCAMLGTANSMCCLAEAMGMSLPGSAAVPAVYSRRYSLAFETGMAVMELVRKGICPRDVVTREAILNAFKVNCAIGGSTNVVLHLLAIAYAAHVKMDIFELGESGRGIPHLVPIMIITTILAIGHLFSVNLDLFYQVPKNQGLLYPTTDVINTYVYRALIDGALEKSAAVNLFQSLVGLVMVVGTNAIIRKISPENSLF